ncbi:MAG TPA: hypothetical protein PKM35_08235 [Holophaga sp.]|nr:hypothetical protein [Holophaga sp.]HPS67629.1 hypothetical protein [Holophaga sp.]
MSDPDSPAPVLPELRPARLCAAVGAMLALSLGFFLSRDRFGKEDPEQFKRRVHAMAWRLIKDHWAGMRQAVAQIATDEGAKAFFAANPGLAPRIRSEAAFVKLARSWRPLVQPLPESPPALESRDLSYAKAVDHVELRYQVPNGTCIFMKWSRGRLVEMRIY